MDNATIKKYLSGLLLIVAILVAVVMVVGCNESTHGTELEGMWTTVYHQSDGSNIILDYSFCGNNWVSTLISTSLIDEMSGTFTLDSTANPKTLDLLITSPPTTDSDMYGSTWYCIYQLDDAFLTLEFGEAVGAARPTSFTNDSILFLRNEATSGCGTPSNSELTSTSEPTWVGLNGETEREYVPCGINCSVVGGNGEAIELINNPEAKDPTWEELRTFLLWADRTEKLQYIEGSWVCADFSEKLHNNAERYGIRSAYVVVSLSNYLPFCGQTVFGCYEACDPLHSCNAFQTTNRGLVFVDDTGNSDGTGIDCTVNVSIGESYKPIGIDTNTNLCSMGVVRDIQITW
jgi:uncharacterized protein (TIGR03067 family)